MKRWFRGGGVLALLGLAGLSVVDWRNQIDAREHDRYGRAVRELRTLDARLNEQVMQSRQALVAHYDGIGRTVVAVLELDAQVATPPQYPSQTEKQALVAAAKSSGEAIREKEQKVELFKSENAVLRNSVRFFPVAARELRDKLRAAAEDAAAERVNDALVAVLAFNQRPGSVEERNAAQDAIDALSMEPVGAVFAPDVDVVLRHARAVLERGVRVDDLTNGILELPTAERMVLLDTAYQRAFLRATHVAERRRTGMFSLAIAAVVLLGVDIILRLKNAARAERAAAERLEEANKALFREKERERELGELKSRFVSMTSHEFRTPMSVILSSTELLEAYGERWSPAKKADHFTRIKSSVAGMTELLDGILVIGKSEAGKLEFCPAPLDVARFARRLLESFAPTVGAKHELVIDISGDYEDAWADEKLLNHMLLNLLSNAVKYSPKGGTVRFSLAREGDRAVFVVSDEGIGIPVEDQARLFDSFHRGKNVGTIPGTGLGLAVVKRSVDVHQGELTVESEPGKGTKFVISLPLTAPSGERAGALSAAE